MWTAADGEARPAAEWVGAGGRACVPCCATVTAAGYPVATVVCVRAKDMKRSWCLAASVTNGAARHSEVATRALNHMLEPGRPNSVRIA